MLKTKWYLPVLVTLLTLLMAGTMTACGEKGQKDDIPTTPQEMSIIVGRAVALRGPIQESYYEIDIEILQSHDVEGVKNPTKNKIGKIITVMCREDMSALNIGEGIAGYVTLYKDRQGQQTYLGSGFLPVTIEEKR